MNAKYSTLNAAIAAAVLVVAAGSGVALGDELAPAVTVVRGSRPPAMHQPAQPQQLHASAVQDMRLSNCRHTYLDPPHTKTAVFCDTNAGPVYCRSAWSDADQTRAALICSPTY